MVRVVVSGLKPEEHMFKESLTGEGIALAEKLEKSVEFSPEDELHLQVKTHVEGKKKRYEIKARMSVKGKIYNIDEPDFKEHQNEWDLYLTTRESLDALKKVVEKHEKPRQKKGLTEDEALAKRAVK